MDGGLCIVPLKPLCFILKNERIIFSKCIVPLKPLCFFLKNERIIFSEVETVLVRRKVMLTASCKLGYSAGFQH
jgi:hypothetical protein